MIKKNKSIWNYDDYNQELLTEKAENAEGW